MTEILAPAEIPAHANVGVNRDIVLGLIRDTDLNFSEIARRVGVTRERVRQLAKYFLGVTGRERIGAHTRLPQHPSIVHAVAAGVTVSSVFGNSVRQSQCRMNGWLVNLRKASISNRYGNVYYVIKRSNTDCDFYVYWLDGGLFLVVPQEEMPMYGTMFSVAPIHAGSYAKRGDWPKFINAWHLLGGEKNGNSATS